MMPRPAPHGFRDVHIRFEHSDWIALHAAARAEGLPMALMARSMVLRELRDRQDQGERHEGAA